jgi:uncharacterized protein (TIGR02246 family)
MSDEKEIRELLARYALTLDVDDVDGCLALFTDDGEFLVFGKMLTGPERIRRMFTRAPRGMHLTGAALIEVTGDSATAQTQVLFVDSSNHELRPALYDDEFVKAGGTWRFHRRRCRFLTPDGLQDSPRERQG